MTVIIVTVVIVTVIIVIYFRRRKKLDALTTNEMFEGQRLAILAMFKDEPTLWVRKKTIWALRFSGIFVMFVPSPAVLGGFRSDDDDDPPLPPSPPPPSSPPPPVTQK